jgi:NAD(P)-dependent dehydrogenase (short-subunit alcohol dehydrogenase family)
MSDSQECGGDVQHRFSGKIALVTGGGSGIGRATALRLAAEGASVVVADIRRDAAEAVATEVTDRGLVAIALEADVSNEVSVRTMIEACVKQYGRLDVLHNNAALLDPGLLARDVAIAGADAEVFVRSFQVNLLGPLMACKYAIPVMLRQGGGAIVNTASIGGVTGKPDLPIYGMTKAALVSLTRSVATQYGKQGIRCNAVAPGVTLTPATLVTRPDDYRATQLAHLLTPRLGEPEDIAATVAYLASDDSGFMNAQVLVVDGGRTAHV